MAERKSDDSPNPESTGDRRSRSQAGLGRRIATIVVSSALVYIVTVGVISVVPQAFWPEAATLDPSITCAEGLRDLRAELLAFAGEHVASGGSERGEVVDRFLRPWDLRHRGLEGRCTGEAHHTWELLGRMRQRLESTLARFDAEEGALARAVDQTLGT